MPTAHHIQQQSAEEHAYSCGCGDVGVALRQELASEHLQTSQYVLVEHLLNVLRPPLDLTDLRVSEQLLLEGTGLRLANVHVMQQLLTDVEYLLLFFHVLLGLNLVVDVLSGDHDDLVVEAALGLLNSVEVDRKLELLGVRVVPQVVHLLQALLQLPLIFVRQHRDGGLKLHGLFGVRDLVDAEVDADLVGAEEVLVRVVNQVHHSDELLDELGAVRVEINRARQHVERVDELLKFGDLIALVGFLLLVLVVFLGNLEHVVAEQLISAKGKQERPQQGIVHIDE